MKIAQIAPIEESVPPKKYGGIELVVYGLTEQLKKRGHEVFLFASGDSETSAKLIPVFPKHIRSYQRFNNVNIRNAMKIEALGRITSVLSKLNVDIIHNHMSWWFLPFSPSFKAPIITTLHGPLDLEQEAHKSYIFKKFKNLPYVSISFNQRKPMPELNYIANIYHGIDIKKFPFSAKKGDYLAFLARATPEKGILEAIMVAKKVGIKLKIAAKVDPVNKDFFQKEVRPLIDGKQIEFLGEINHKEKTNFLKNSMALLAPLKWREPFGLYFIESMACGTPVIAFDKGSAKEVIKDGKTGFVVKDISEMAKSIGKIDQINRKDCREWVEKKFTIEKMVNNYEKVYYQITKKIK